MCRKLKVLSGVVVDTITRIWSLFIRKYSSKDLSQRRMRNEFGFFKIRIYYAISQLSKEERERGVVCASAGNHLKMPILVIMRWRFWQQFLCLLQHRNKRLGKVCFFGGEFVTIAGARYLYVSAKAAIRICISTENRTFIDPFDDAHVQVGHDCSLWNSWRSP